MTETVTVCIPTWRSAAFIEHTLDCARAQTHARLRIVVSVDPSDDDTLATCRACAARDARIEVLAQPQRLGWSQNANAALDRAAAGFAFLYFHDDLIAPDYVEQLLAALRARPDAASAHCDLEEFGLMEAVRPAHDYAGPPLRRLVDFLLTRRGTTLRSLMRIGPDAARIRFPQLPGDNHWTAYVFHLRLLAAGPAVAVRQPLYRRWQREGSLTRSAGWNPEAVAMLHASQRAALGPCLDLIRAAATTPGEWALGRYCLRLFCRWFSRQHQLRLCGGGLGDPTLDAIELADASRSEALAHGDAEVAGWIHATERSIAELEAQIASLAAQARSPA